MSAAVPAVMMQTNPDEVMNLIPCSSCFRKRRVTTLFEVGQGYVPELAVLYQDIRRTSVDQRFPLLAEEILPRERCVECIRRMYRVAYKTQDALRLMDQWWEVVRHTRWTRDQAKLRLKQERRERRLQEKQRRRDERERLASQPAAPPPPKKYGNEPRPIAATAPSKKKNKKKESQKQRGNRHDRR